MPETNRSDIAQFVSAILSRWVVIAAFSFAGLVMAILYLGHATYKYSVVYRVSPTQSDVSGFSRRLGGLAAVAGISLGADKMSSPFDLYVDTVYSPEVAADLARDKRIMQNVFSNEWDAASRTFRKPESAIGSISVFLKTILGIPVYEWESPGPERLQEFLEKEVILIRDPKKSTVSLSMEYKDPKFAGYLLARMHESTDNIIRQRALDRSTKYISYISAKLQEVVLVEHREALAETLGEQERIRMMSSSDISYAAEPLGEPVTSLRPTNPKPVLMLVLGLFVGGFAGTVVAIALLIRANMKQQAGEVA